MESKLTISAFREKLQNSTKIGDPKLKLSPLSMFMMFGQSSKTFYGLFDQTTFCLTTNFITSPTLFILTGSYKSVNGKIKIQYKIEPRYKYQNLWLIFVSIFGFIFFNSTRIFKNMFLSTESLMVNFFLIFMISFGIWDIMKRKKKLEQDFITIFEIVN